MTTTQNETKRGSFLSLRYKLLIGFTLLFSIVFSVAYYWFYQFATDSALNQIRNDMVETLDGAANGIDIESFKEMAQAALKGESSPYYDQHIQWLATVREIEPRGVTYTFVPTQDTKDYEVLFLGDVTVTFNPDKAAAFGEPYKALPENTKLYSGLTELTTNLESYTDPFGRWVSAYRPLKDSSGKVVGGIGIDFKADYVDTVQQAIIDSIFVAFLVTYLILFVTVWVIANIFTKPISRLTGLAAKFGEGDYEHDQDLATLSETRFPDEIATLAQVFSIMVGKIRKREEGLKKQVAELKIEIDEVKRSKQVSEIVDSDFFQDLQAKARAMRKRGSEQESSSDDGQ